MPEYFEKHVSGATGKESDSGGEEGSTNHAQFVDLLTQHRTRLLAFIRTLTLFHESDAEEVFQNSCMAAWDKFHQFDQDRESSDFGAWICRMAYYEALRLRDSRKRLRFLSEEALEALADASLPIARQLNERRECLAECLKKLDGKDLAMIESRYTEALRPKEIARKTGNTVKSVYRNLSRIHGLLQKCVQHSMRLDGADGGA